MNRHVSPINGLYRLFKLFKDLHTFGHGDPANPPDFSEECCHGYSLWSTNRGIHVTEGNAKLGSFNFVLSLTVA